MICRSFRFVREGSKRNSPKESLRGINRNKLERPPLWIALQVGREP